jgi:hypothetical protein
MSIPYSITIVETAGYGQGYGNTGQHERTEKDGIRKSRRKSCAKFDVS